MGTNTAIHRQQLFHWVGSHIEEESTTVRLNDERRVKYVDALRGALTKGLWVKTPRKPDQLGDGSLIKVKRPIVCFTEWSLTQSSKHTKSYGRLGFGFPKRFVLDRGGQPVTYLRDSKTNDPYSVALKYIAGWLKDASFGGLPFDEIKRHFDYLTHFNKRIKPVAPPKPTARPKRVYKKPGVPVEPDIFARKYGASLSHLEEREWRIVFDESIMGYFTSGPGGANFPQFYMPIVPGSELFTVVLPDNKTVHMALEDGVIDRALFPPNAPHVTVLSLQDIGTF